jgi:hypothetical protein
LPSGSVPSIAWMTVEKYRVLRVLPQRQRDGVAVDAE